MAKSPAKGAVSWDEIDALLDLALDLEGPDRKTFLDGLDESVRVKVQAALTGEAAEFVDALVRTSLDGGLEPFDTSLTPQTVGPWRLVRELGAGGMAQVFEARRENADFEQRAAIKIMWPFRSDARFLERFVQERRILAGLNHPGIAGLLDGGMLSDNRPWFAMEYVEGLPIDQFCQGLDLSARLAIFLQVCESVEFAHGRLIVHRDIKPGNILVDETGRVRLLDFGIAKLMDAADDVAATRTGGSILTLQYASPEQVTQAPLTVASDIYQLGLLLYRLVAGRLPYDLEGLSLKQAVETISSEDPPPPSRFWEGIGSDLDAIVLFALRKEPSQRYRSVSVLALDVRRYLEGRPVAAQPQSRWYVLRRFVRRNAPLVAASALVVIALGVATLVSISMARRASLEAERSTTALQVLTSVFDQADPFGEPGPDITLGAALVERFDRIAEQVDHDPALALQVFNYLGRMYSELGMFDQAERSYQRALMNAEASSNSGRLHQLAAFAGITAALNDQGHFQETLEYIGGLRLGPAADAEEARFQVRILIEQATASYRSGLHDSSAIPLAEAQALIDKFRLADPELNYLFHAAMAEVARYAEDFAASEQHAREGASYAAEAGEYGAEATLLQSLGIYLGRQGRLEEAKSYFLESMAIVDEHAPGHPSRLKFAVNFAGWLFRSNEFEASVKLLDDTLSALEGTPDRHLWAFANRDLATYAFATGDMALSVRALLLYLEVVPELYGEDSPDAAIAGVLLARHLSLAGLHYESLESIRRALATHPQLGEFDLGAYQAELRIDAGLVDAAVRDYRPGDHADDLNARLLDLKFVCIAGDFDALESRLAAVGPKNLGGGHMDNRLTAWRFLMEAAVARHRGSDPMSALDMAFKTLSETPRLSSLEEWRLLREIVPLYETISSLPAVVDAAWSDIQGQRAVAREILLREGPAAGISGPSEATPARALSNPLPLACTR